MCFDVSLPGSVGVAEGVPGDAANALRCSLGDGLTVLLWVPDDGIDGDLGFRPTGAECTTVHVRVEAASVSASLRDALTEYDPHDYPRGELGTWMRDVHDHVLGLLSRFLSYVRNEIGQWLLDDLAERDPDQFFHHSDARWTLDGTTWSRMRGPVGDRHTLNLIITPPLVPADWTRIEAFLNTGKDVDITKRLATRAQLLASDGDMKGAVLEAAICLERELSLLVIRYLEQREIHPGPVVEGKERSTTRLLRVWLPLIRPGTDTNELEAGKRIIECRNNILHQAHTQVGDNLRAHVLSVVQLARRLCDERNAGAVR